MTKNKLVYGGLSLLMVAAAFWVSTMLINAKPKPQKDKAKHNTTYVKTQNVKAVQTVSEMVYRGRVTAFDNVSLAAEVQGKIVQGDVRFKAGESFQKGDVLLTIYSRDVEASLKSGKSSFLQTLSAVLPDLKIDYPNEYAKWNMFFEAFDVQDPLPQLPSINSNKEKVFLAANNVLASYYSLQQKEINLSRYTIKAPFKGSFKSVSKEIGAVASPGVELASIIRSDLLEIVVPVFPNDLNYITKGAAVNLTKSSGETATATVSRLAEFVDETTQSVNVYLTCIATQNCRLLQGEYVDITFGGYEVVGFEIPREALVDQAYVYELKDQKLQKVAVNILRQLNDAYIISGVDSNTTIVVESLASISQTTDYLAR